MINTHTQTINNALSAHRSTNIMDNGITHNIRLLRQTTWHGSDNFRAFGSDKTREKHKFRSRLICNFEWEID